MSKDDLQNSNSRGNDLETKVQPEIPTILLIERAKLILRGQQAEAEQVLKLSQELKKIRAFNYARRILMHSRNQPGIKKELAIKMDQQYALCTYKDQDLPVIKRLDQALQILREERLNLDHTQDQETLGLAGAIFKRKWEATGQQTNLEKAMYYYGKGMEQGYEKDFGYTAINAAYIHDLLAWLEDHDTINIEQSKETTGSHRRQAEIIRKECVEILTALIREPANSYLETAWWYQVTVAEAFFGLRDYENARLWVQSAMSLDKTTEWEKESFTRQLAQLASIQDVEGLASPGSPAGSVLMELTEGDVTALQTVLSGKAGIALSGGGFRASLYHIGVLAKLAELDMLRHIEVLSCVSGGSIIGAHYYLEVKRLLEGTPDKDITRDHYIQIVQKISNEFLDGVQRNIRTRVLSNWLLNVKMAMSKKYSRTMRVGELYEKEIFSKVQDGVGNRERWLHELFIFPVKKNGEPQKEFNPKYDNWRRKAKVPILILNATTLNTGHNWQFTASWMGESPAAIQKIDGNYRLRRMYFRPDGEEVPEERKIRLGYAVAASSCVPGMFEPFSMYDLYPEKVVRLVDGGVHDNQGICGLLEQDCSVLLLSDASGQMNSEDDPKMSVLGVPMRANDILMERVRNEQFSDMESRFQAGLLKGRLFIHLKLDLDVEVVDWTDCEDPSDETLVSGYDKQLTFYGIRKKTQEILAAIRTDLDSFNDTEAAALMTSGYLMLANTFEKFISRFPVSKEKGPGWWFLDVADNLKKERIPEQFMALLTIAKNRVFKVWSLSKSLKFIAITLGIILGVLIVAGFIYWREKQIFNSTTYTLGDVGMMIFWTVAALFVGKTIVGIIRFKNTAMRLATGLSFLTIGWLASILHLAWFDKVYLKIGKLRKSR